MAGCTSRWYFFPSGSHVLLMRQDIHQRGQKAKCSFHPEIATVIKVFGPRFTDAGFRMEYITEGQQVTTEYVRKGLYKFGRGLLRSISATKKDY